MDTLTIEASKYTPSIIMDAHKGTIDIRGKSYPENTFEFYKPVMEWLEEYFQSPAPKTTLTMEIIYFNSSSSKFFYDLLDFFEDHRQQTDLTVNWVYDEENESALEAGEEFMEDFEDLPFNLVEKNITEEV